jgi:hypothetical protein
LFSIFDRQKSVRIWRANQQLAKTCILVGQDASRAVYGLIGRGFVLIEPRQVRDFGRQASFWMQPARNLINFQTKKDTSHALELVKARLPIPCSFIDDLCKDLPASAASLERKDSGGKSWVYSRAEFPAGGVRGQSVVMGTRTADRAREYAEASRKEAMEIDMQKVLFEKAPQSGAATSNHWGAASSANLGPSDFSKQAGKSMPAGSVSTSARKNSSADSYMTQEEMDAVLEKVVGEFQCPKAAVDVPLIFVRIPRVGEAGHQVFEGWNS